MMLNSLFTPEGVSGLIFLLLITITFIGAGLATYAKRLIRSVCGLAICFLGVAGLYYFLNSPFVAFMELLIYIGAVTVTIAFAIMLADPDETKMARRNRGISGWLAGSCGGLFAFGLAYVAKNGEWMAPATKINDGSVKALGLSLLTNYSMVFELISLVLLVAIVGSLALARIGRDKA